NVFCIFGHLLIFVVVFCSGNFKTKSTSSSSAYLPTKNETSFSNSHI
ncbi:unnamed protein product, partial [Arabidopsis halleri]